MISGKLLKEAEDFMHSNSEEFGVPSVFQVDLSNKKGQELSKELGSDSKIVLLGTTLMDCMLGPVMTRNKLAEHIEMGVEKADELLGNFPEVSEKEKGNILHCVREHHGVEKFYSLESEICCNADCYKFLSVEGVIGSIHRSREMSVSEIVELYVNKAEEKWNALSLDVCKKELEPQYEATKVFLSAYESRNA